MLPARISYFGTGNGLRATQSLIRRRGSEAMSRAELGGIKERTCGRSSTMRMLLRCAIYATGFLFLFGFLLAVVGGDDKEFEDEALITPYTAKHSVVSSGREWVLDRAHTVTSKIAAPLSGKHAGKSNSVPHPVLEFPKFQSKMYKLTADDWPSYQARLTDFARETFGNDVAKWAVKMLRKSGGDKRMEPIPSQVWQTGKDIPTMPGSFQQVNPGASFNFFDDSMLESWATKHFNGSVAKRIWDGMERIVLKADFWRYLVLFLEGGFYSDTDADCLKPIDVWGKVDAVKWDLGDRVSQDILDAPPRVVVGIEVDVPDVTGWETFWPRPIQIVQWTMAGSAGHPIYLDSIRRVVESMQAVKDWDYERKEQARDLLHEALTSEGSTLKQRKTFFEDKELFAKIADMLSVDPFDKEKGGTMSLIEATGPGAFTDAVLSYLLARYGVHWSQLHNIQTATRIGDVAILPITGFAPFYKPDWQRWKGIETGAMAVVGDISHPQAMVYHHFSGSWRTDEDNHI